MDSRDWPSARSGQSARPGGEGPLPRWWKLLLGALLALVGLWRGSWLDGPLLAQVTTLLHPGPWLPRSGGCVPRSVAVGNFNGDSFADLAVANFGSDNVTILLGNGSGNFTQPATSPEAVGTLPQSVAVGNFNGDSFADLAVANSGSDNVTILLGDGSGNFTQPATSPEAVGVCPDSVAVGDFNGDSFADLAVANATSNNVTILLGDGSGNFSPAPGSPWRWAISPPRWRWGLFNGDSFLDLAVANAFSNTVTILLGNGSGSFTPAPGSPVAVGNEPASVAVGNFNGDSFPDLAVANAAANTVTILLGNGSGGFTPVPAPPWRQALSPSPWRWGASTAIASPTSPSPTPTPTT